MINNKDFVIHNCNTMYNILFKLTITNYIKSVIQYNTIQLRHPSFLSSVIKCNTMYDYVR